MRRKFFYSILLLITVLIIGSHFFILLYNDAFELFGASMFFVLLSGLILLIDVISIIIYEIVAWRKRKRGIISE